MIDTHTDAEIKTILEKYRRVCVVGASHTPGKAANEVPLYLIDKGYEIIPVNPTVPSVFGIKAYKSVGEVDKMFDILDVFRPSDEVYGIIKQAIDKKPRVIWMQEGIYNKEAKEISESEGITVIYNRCMMKEHIRLFGS
ncbi:CoA-binding protein [Candidatus Parvarchaeota archaeon]|nr:CoA-binding protein [Candidatus Parvarchaeota archaeon]